MPVDVVRCPRCLTDNPATASRCTRCDLLLVGELLPILVDAEPAAPVPTADVSADGEADRTAVDPRVKVLGATAAVLAVALLWALGSRTPAGRATATAPGSSTTTTATTATTRPADTTPAMVAPTTSGPVTALPPAPAAPGTPGTAGGSVTGNSAVPYPTTTVPFVDEATGTRLAVASTTGRITIVDLDASELQDHDLDEMQLPDSSYSGSLPPLIRRGSQLVLPGINGAVLAGPFDLSASTRRIGEALLVLASNHPDRVWLVSRKSTGPATIEERDMAGKVTFAPVPLPVDTVPRAAMADGLVLSRGDRFQVWDPATRATRFTSADGVVFHAAAGDTIAWSAGCDSRLCPLHLTTLPAGTERVVYVPDEPVGNPVFSPDGRWLAFERRVQLSDPVNGSRGRLAIVDVARGTVAVTALPGGSRGLLTWNSAGTWVFCLGVEGGSAGQIYAAKRGAASASTVQMTWHGRFDAIVAS